MVLGKKHPERVFVHPNFKRMIKVKASLEDKSIIDCSEDLAEELERVLRGRGLLKDVDGVTDEERKKKNRLFF